MSQGSFVDAIAVADRIHSIRQSLPATVRLIAVTKSVPVEAMRAAYAAGVRDFGESRLQEAQAKQAELQDLPDLTWHLIGHLQSNKAAKALQHFQWIHSVDSLKLAERLNQCATDRPEKPTICLQVKLLPDPAKYGWHVPELWADLPALDRCTHLNIQGLMTICPLDASDPQIQTIFTGLRELAQQIQQAAYSHLGMQELSMGMSDDYPMAVAAGATLIRLGRVLFA